MNLSGRKKPVTSKKKKKPVTDKEKEKKSTTGKGKKIVYTNFDKLVKNNKTSCLGESNSTGVGAIRLSYSSSVSDKKLKNDIFYFVKKGTNKITINNSTPFLLRRDDCVLIRREDSYEITSMSKSGTDLILFYSEDHFL